MNCVYKSCVTGNHLTKLINMLSAAYCIMNVFDLCSMCNKPRKKKLTVALERPCEYEDFDLLLHMVLQRCTSQHTAGEFSLSASPSDMKVDGGGRVFLAAGNQLLRLDSNLTLQENVTLGSMQCAQGGAEL